MFTTINKSVTAPSASIYTPIEFMVYQNQQQNQIVILFFFNPRMFLYWACWSVHPAIFSEAPKNCLGSNLIKRIIFTKCWHTMQWLCSLSHCLTPLQSRAESWIPWELLTSHMRFRQTKMKSCCSIVFKDPHLSWSPLVIKWYTNEYSPLWHNP